MLISTITSTLQSVKSDSLKVPCNNIALIVVYDEMWD